MKLYVHLSMYIPTTTVLVASSYAIAILQVSGSFAPPAQSPQVQESFVGRVFVGCVWVLFLLFFGAVGFSCHPTIDYHNHLFFVGFLAYSSIHRLLETYKKDGFGS